MLENFQKVSLINIKRIRKHIHNILLKLASIWFIYYLIAVYLPRLQDISSSCFRITLLVEFLAGRNFRGTKIRGSSIFLTIFLCLAVTFEQLYNKDYKRKITSWFFHKIRNACRYTTLKTVISLI